MWGQSERQRICTVATNEEGLLQQRVAMPRHLLSRPKAFSIACRCLYMCRSISLFFFRFDLEGTTAPAPISPASAGTSPVS